MRVAPAVIVLDPGNGPEPTLRPRAADAGIDAAERALTLGLARHIAQYLSDDEGRAQAARRGKRVAAFLTRWDDGRLGEAERAGLAKQHGAGLFLGLHFNRGGERGTEAWIDRKHATPHFVMHDGTLVAAEEGPGEPSSPFRNLNHVDDAAFAAAMAEVTYAAIRNVDSTAALRSATYRRSEHGQDYQPPPGVKMRARGVLLDSALGRPAGACRACILMVDFLDHPHVYRLFAGTGGQALQHALARALARQLTELV